MRKSLRFQRPIFAMVAGVVTFLAFEILLPAAGTQQQANDCLGVSTGATAGAASLVLLRL